LDAKADRGLWLFLAPTAAVRRKDLDLLRKPVDAEARASVLIRASAPGSRMRSSGNTASYTRILVPLLTTACNLDEKSFWPQKRRREGHPVLLDRRITYKQGLFETVFSALLGSWKSKRRFEIPRKLEPPFPKLNWMWLRGCQFQLGKTREAPKKN
jgi:hypothetical protein